MNNDSQDTPIAYSTLVVLSYLASICSWLTLLLLRIVKFFANEFTVHSRAAIGAILVIAIVSTVYLRKSGRKRFAQFAQNQGKGQLSSVQVIVITLFVIGYSVFIGWGLGLFVQRN